MTKMLKESALVAVAAVCIAAAGAFDPKVVDKEFLLKQKMVVEMLSHVPQADVVYTEFYKPEWTMTCDQSDESPEFREKCRELLARYDYGMLRRGADFSIFYAQHRLEARLLFHVLYHVSWERFPDVVGWARTRMNEDLFDYVFRVVIAHRTDTKMFHLPAAYVTRPEKFFDADVIRQAYLYKMSHPLEETTTKNEPYTINANCSIPTARFPDAAMSYYLNDVELNNFYARVHAEYPFWLETGMYGHRTSRRGEIEFIVHKMLYNRYYMERLANNLGHVEYIDFDRPIATGYWGSKRCPGGMIEVTREPMTMIPEHMLPHKRTLLDYVSRITEAADTGFVRHANGTPVSIRTENGFEIISNIIFGNANSLNPAYYGSIQTYFRHILGFACKPDSDHEIYSTDMEHYVTSLKDPAFYAMIRNMLSYFMKYIEHLPRYAKEELAFDGVTVDSVAVDKIVTYHEPDESDISEGVRVIDTKDAENIHIHARQMRLNHKPFTWHLTIASETEKPCVIRMFLGPKSTDTANKFKIDENWMHFYEIDYFVYDLKAGINKIDRKSTDTVFASSNYDDNEDLHERLTKAINTDQKFVYKPIITRFPQHMLIPKGKPEGMTYELFVYVSEYKETLHVDDIAPFYNWTMYDNKPFGFPLDRPMVASNFHQPNMYTRDITIWHKSEKEMNLTV